MKNMTVKPSWASGEDEKLYEFLPIFVPKTFRKWKSHAFEESTSFFAAHIWQDDALSASTLVSARAHKHHRRALAHRHTHTRAHARARRNHTLTSAGVAGRKKKGPSLHSDLFSQRRRIF